MSNQHAINTVHLSTARVYQTLACQDNTLSLVCPEGGVIRVTEATFGRTTASVCPKEGAQATTNCSEPTALQTASRMCNNEHKCVVNVTTSVFGEPCFDVHKYLNVSFKCGGECHYTRPIQQTSCYTLLFYQFWADELATSSLHACSGASGSA